MKNIIIVFSAIILLSGCANSSKTYAPDGREAYSIDCSGLARTWGMCLEKAGDLCGAKGYDIYTSTGDKGWVATAQPDFAMAGSTISRNLLIACKK
ncbi:hypothetical protein [Serratia sp. UGAL515B_01]|uniref:hypothetical protein n=1 Tax=Serratia sp. UGAL515B_01 TaxID=2986763 RepID=UPI00295351E8|nr:hypothetical protein [Serratia sp. UGAL515B_01]WON77586.1 hypothetical protein OK023_02435 [Serratia sp. UGAL515B_01]